MADTNALPAPSSRLELVRPIAGPNDIIERHKELTRLITDGLEDGRDYGSIPGIGDKKTLKKPGAERLALAHGCVPKYAIVEQEVDHSREVAYELRKWFDADRRDRGVSEAMRSAGTGRWKKTPNGKWDWQEVYKESGTSLGLYRYLVRCSLVRHDGLVVGESIGACSTLESKYVRAPRDHEHTVLRMAEKRALVGAVLNAFGLSDRFSGDDDDGGDGQRSGDAAEGSATPIDKLNFAQVLEEAPSRVAEEQPYNEYLRTVSQGITPKQRYLLVHWCRMRRNLAQGLEEDHGFKEEHRKALADAKAILTGSGA